jgi:hypothetical protein
MTTYDDDLLAARFDALAPVPLAGDWADVVARAGVARKGQPRLPRSRPLSRRWRLVVVLAVVALVAVVTASAVAVRAFVIDKGIIGLPPVGATPSTPERGVLEMYYWVTGGRASDYARSRTWVYADGRLIRLGAPPRRGFLEQRLTREGVELLRSEILAAGGFGHAQPPPGSTSLIGSFRPADIKVRKGDRLVPLRWASDLKRLEARLTNPGAWLPASAWKQPKVRAYVPSRFEVCAAVLMGEPGHIKFQRMRPARIVALLPEAVQNVLRGRDWNARGAGPGCFAVTTNEARSVAKALDDAGPATARKGGLINVTYAFDAPGPSRQVSIGFLPFLPHGKLTYAQCC